MDIKKTIKKIKKKRLTLIERKALPIIYDLQKFEYTHSSNNHLSYYHVSGDVMFAYSKKRDMFWYHKKFKGNYNYADFNKSILPILKKHIENILKLDLSSTRWVKMSNNDINIFEKIYFGVSIDI